MSQGVAIEWATAHRVASQLVGLLEDACERIEIAGSVRRQKATVHDLEIVAISRRGRAPIHGLFETTWVDVDELDEALDALRQSGTLTLRPVLVERANGSQEIQTRDGEAYKALSYQGVPVDLFITDAERWGAILALRTGPFDWNQRLVTDCKRHFRQLQDGRVLHLGRPVPTPEEADFFRAMGVPWVEPRDRTADALRFDPELLARVPA